MSEDFKPGTRPVLRLAGLDADRGFVSRDEENAALWQAVLALLMRIHLEPDAEARRGAGASDQQVLMALRAALAENFGIEAGGYLAWAAVLHGCRQKPTLASLHAWERLMFEWQERGATAPRVALILRAAGFAQPLAPVTLEAIDRWVTTPESALGEASAIIGALFGRRLVSFSLRDDGFEPAHDALFRDLVGSVVASPTLVSVRQRVRADGPVARWIVEYTHDGVEQSFDSAAKGLSRDLDGIMADVDELLARIGRQERVFRLAPGRAGNGEVAVFVVADGLRFAQLSQRLRLPLLRAPRIAAAAVQVETIDASGPPSEPHGAETYAPSSFLPLADTPSIFVDSTYAAPPPPVAAPALPRAPSTPVRLAGGPQPADPAMRSLLSSLRRSFGAGRLLQGGRWARQAHVEPPSWLRASADPVGILYARQELLLRKGRIVWAALVQANETLYAAGDQDLPGLIVYSGDAYFDARPAELAGIGARLAELKTSPVGPAELRGFGDRIRNDSGRPLDVVLPPDFGLHEVRVTSFMGIRAHLPDGVLAADWFPVLTHSSSVIPMIVPCAWWPAALRAAWDTRRLSADAGHGAGVAP